MQRDSITGQVRPENLSGKTFNQLTGIQLVSRNKHGNSRWLWQCSCGTLAVVIAANVKNGHTQSCGCLTHRARRRRSLVPTKQIPEYGIWRNMKTRCLNPKNQKFQRYGGRGITICPRLLSYEGFIATVGNRPSSQLSLDRINNDGHYSCGQCELCVANGWPMNLRWATIAVQSQNKSNTRHITIGDETLCLSEWARKLNISWKRVLQLAKN